MAHDPATAPRMTYIDEELGSSARLRSSCQRLARMGKTNARQSIRCSTISGAVTRVGDETIGEVWSLYDGQDLLNEVDPRFSENIRRHVRKAIHEDPFHVSANTDPKGDRSKRPQDQDPDTPLHVVKETDAGIVVRGAKYETAAAYSNQAFV